jgi:hypothetical protein
MATSQELIALLHQLRNAASPLHRLKLAALAWRTLRGLTPHDRMVVAKTLGLEGAEHLVEQLGHSKGISPSALLTAIHRAEEADPDHLRELLHQSLDPGRRGEIVGSALASVEHWLEEAVPAQDRGDADHAAAEQDAEQIAADAGSADSTIAPAPIPIPAQPVAVVPDAETADTPQPPAEAPDSGPQPEPPQPPQAEPQPVSPPPARKLEPPPTEAQRRPPMPPTPPRPPAPLVERLTRLTSSLARLRALSGSSQEVQCMTLHELREVVEMFPAGWPRRRALESVLGAGAPEDLRKALDLVEALADPRSRLWALTALAARHRLTAKGKERLLALAHGSPALQRRLRLRLRRPR